MTQDVLTTQDWDAQRGHGGTPFRLFSQAGASDTLLFQSSGVSNTMLTKHALRPTLECLEDRWVPATVQCVAGGIYIREPVGPLLVQTVGPGFVFVGDSAGSLIASGIASQIFITGTDAADYITIRANNFTFGGNLVISTGNGNDTIDMSGRFAGNGTLVTGYGNDVIVSTSSAVTFDGQLTVADVGGLNTFYQNGQHFTIGRDLTISGLGNYVMGPGSNLRVGGFGSFTALPNFSGPVTMRLNGNSVVIGKIMAIRGTVLGDLVDIDAEFSVGSNMFLSMGSGDNAFLYTPAGGRGVLGNLFYEGGSFVDNVILNANASVAGVATFSLGHGVNLFQDDAATTYNADVNVYGGNQLDTLNLNGVIDGRLNIILGNGANNTTVTTRPAGLLQYRGGNGTEAFLLRGAGVYNLDVSFGTGPITFDINSAGLFLNGNVRGGGGPATFIQGAGQLLPTFSFINFP